MDNWFILFFMLLAYLDINTKIKKILNNQSKDSPKDFSLLEKLKGKEVKIEIDDEYVSLFNTTPKGILKNFNDVWLILETDNKGKKELVYYRISDIKGVLEIKEKE